MGTDAEQLTVYPNRVSRREHQKYLARRRRRIRRRRRARIRRVRFWRTLYTTRFWIRTLIVLAVCLAIAFWAKFAYIYDIPSSAKPIHSGTLKLMSRLRTGGLARPFLIWADISPTRYPLYYRAIRMLYCWTILASTKAWLNCPNLSGLHIQPIRCSRCTP